MALAQLELSQFQQFMFDKTTEEWMAMSGAELFEYMKYFSIGVDIDQVQYLRNDSKFIYALFQHLLNGTTLTKHPVFTQYVSFEVTGQKFVRIELERDTWDAHMPSYDQWAELADQHRGVWFHRNIQNSDTVRFWLNTPAEIRTANDFGRQVMYSLDWLWHQLTYFDHELRHLYDIQKVFMLFAHTNRTIIVNDPGFGKLVDVSSTAASTATPVEVYGYPSSVAKSSGSRRRARSAFESVAASSSTTDGGSNRMSTAELISKNVDFMVFLPFYKSHHQTMVGKSKSITERKFKFGTRFRENQNYEQYSIVPHKFPGFYLLPTGHKYVEISPTHRTTKTYSKNPDSAFYMVAYFQARK